MQRVYCINALRAILRSWIEISNLITARLNNKFGVHRQPVRTYRPRKCYEKQTSYFEPFRGIRYFDSTYVPVHLIAFPVLHTVTVNLFEVLPFNCDGLHKHRKQTTYRYNLLVRYLLSRWYCILVSVKSLTKHLLIIKKKSLKTPMSVKHKTSVSSKKSIIQQAHREDKIQQTTKTSSTKSNVYNVHVYQ